ncbi:MAG: hypothetical protein AAFX56_02010 [Pseudomonadota bacterium]
MNAAPRAQRGAALLLIMLVILAAASAILVNRFNAARLVSLKLTASAEVLSEARSALLAYAAVQPELVPGAPVRLPCPDLDASGGFADGEAHSSACGAAGESMLGRLPWRTLGLEVLKDSSSACLWYAVSGDFKAAGAQSAALLNPDTAGQFRLYNSENGALLAGDLAENRPVALVFAPGAALPGQQRVTSGTESCGSTYDASEFLDAVAAYGIDNASLSGVPDTLQDFATALSVRSDLSDRVLVIKQSDIADIVNNRHDYKAVREALGLAVTSCLAEYGKHNAAGPGDRRLPWPAPLSLADYRSTANYDDVAGAGLAGRLPDRVDDSAAASGNAIDEILSACDAGAVPAWNSAMRNQWQQWKDHFFYVVAESFAPGAAIPSTCPNCLTVNGAGNYAAVVVFAGSALPSQRRTAPPLDPDSKQQVSNYLEGRNVLAFPHASGVLDLQSALPSAGFNDLLFCVDAGLTATIC